MSLYKLYKWFYIDGLSQTQARESTDISQEVFDKLLIEIKKERITNLALLTNEKVRGYLKKLGCLVIQ